ncbi:MAG: hypothetical protein ACK4GT_08705 [Pararhodobacter sp.]
MRLLPAVVLAALAATTPALADEAWDTIYGPLQWETDIGDIAVLNLFGEDVPSPAFMRFFVNGLAADVSGGRGLYHGYWTATGGDIGCSAQLIDDLGTKTPYWGRFSIQFVNSDFPSSWTGLMGDCFDDPEAIVSGVPLYGD